MKEKKSTADSIGLIFDKIHATAPEGTWDNLPTDGARNYKHYLYGHKKEERSEMTT